jgi:nucleotide-binding universal stress UspA family protein
VLAFASGFETFAAYAGDVVPAMRKSGAAVLARARARAAAAGLEVDTLLLESTGPRASELIVEQARAWAADLIVIGTHGRRGIGRFLLGSDAEQVLRLAPVPVLLVRSGKDEAANAARSSAEPRRYVAAQEGQAHATQ